MSDTARFVIVGGPRTGKTTLSKRFEARGFIVRHTDTLIGECSWSEASARIAEAWLGGPGKWVVEGVAAVRALRKWLAAHPTGAPCDCVIVLREPREARSAGQEAMAKGHEKIWREIYPELVRRGVLFDTPEKY